MSPNPFHSYRVAGNACNAFAVGEIGSDDDFFLVGALPPDESSYPLLTGNVLSAEGKPLFRLVRNVLESNPGGCTKVLGDGLGYEIRDAAGALVLKVSAQIERPADAPSGTYVTTVTGNFHDKSGRSVFNIGAGDDQIASDLKGMFGLSGFGVVGKAIGKMSETETEVAKAVIQSGGSNHRVLKGPIKGQTVELDRVALCDAQLSECTINVRSSSVAFIGSKTAFHSCEVNFFDGSAVLKNLIAHVLREGKG